MRYNEFFSSSSLVLSCFSESLDITGYHWISLDITGYHWATAPLHCCAHAPNHSGNLPHNLIAQGDINHNNLSLRTIASMLRVEHLNLSPFNIIQGSQDPNKAKHEGQSGQSDQLGIR